MPVFSFPQKRSSVPNALAEEGALLTVEISVPPAFKTFLQEEGFPVPEPRAGFAIIDTGASASAVDESIFSELGIAPIDLIRTSTPHGVAESFIYPAAVSFPGLNLAEMHMETLIGCRLNWQDDVTNEVIMLLGRDLLKDFLLVYNGKSEDVFLAY